MQGWGAPLAAATFWGRPARVERQAHPGRVVGVVGLGRARGRGPRRRLGRGSRAAPHRCPSYRRPDTERPSVGGGRVGTAVGSSPRPGGGARVPDRRRPALRHRLGRARRRPRRGFFAGASRPAHGDADGDAAAGPGAESVRLARAGRCRACRVVGQRGGRSGNGVGQRQRGRSPRGARRSTPHRGHSASPRRRRVRAVAVASRAGGERPGLRRRAGRRRAGTVHPAHPGGAGVRRPHDRADLPAARGGAAARPRARRRLEADPVTTRDFQTTGLGHLLVVSGRDVAMVLAPVVAFAGALRVGALTRFGMGLGVVVLFVVLTGAEPSVLRAGAMASLALIGSCSASLGRRARSWPRRCWRCSSSTRGSCTRSGSSCPSRYGGHGHASDAACRAARPAAASPIAMAFGTTIAAQLGVTPLLLFHFHEVPASPSRRTWRRSRGLPGAAPWDRGLGSGPGLAAARARGVVRRRASRCATWRSVASTLAKAPIAWITSGGGPWVLDRRASLRRDRGLDAQRMASSAPAGRRRDRACAVGGVAGALGAGPPAGLTVRVARHRTGRLRS